MALTSLAAVQMIPGMAKKPAAWLQSLVLAMDAAIIKYLQRNIELDDYTQFLSGKGRSEIVLKQTPIVTINHLYLDDAGYFGKAPGAFAAGTELTEGVDFVAVIDDGATLSESGLVLKISGANGGFLGAYPRQCYPSKLAGSKPPFWPAGYGNIKVEYSAGYAEVPLDLANAAASLVVYAARNQPGGGILSNESLGSYSYSTIQLAATGNCPELGSIGETLKAYREAPL